MANLVSCFTPVLSFFLLPAAHDVVSVEVGSQ
jgi:hypothetical protein